MLLAGAGCGAETVGSDAPLDTSSYRVEVHSEVTGIGLPYSFTSTTLAVEADEWTRIQQQRQEQDDGASSAEGSREPSCG